MLKINNKHFTYFFIILIYVHEAKNITNELYFYADVILIDVSLLSFLLR